MSFVPAETAPLPLKIPGELIHDTPEEAVSAFIEAVGEPPVEGTLELLIAEKENDPAIKFGVQASYYLNYIAIAGPGERKVRAYVKTNGVAAWVGHERNVDALIDVFPYLERDPSTIAKGFAREWVWIPKGHLNDEGIDVVFALAYSHALPSDGVARPRAGH